MRNREIIPKEFYVRDPEPVAKQLLGKRLIRRLDEISLEGIIVETEAYYGLDDPASRAFHGMKTYNSPMWREPGRTFIYNVHRYWMLNVVAHEPDRIGAVLIRAIEPTEGVEIMKRNRPEWGISNLTSGPGKLTVAFRIDKSLNDCQVFSSVSGIMIANSNIKPEIGRSHRIGVREDLDRELRFFIRGNKFVSR